MIYFVYSHTFSAFCNVVQTVNILIRTPLFGFVSEEHQAVESVTLDEDNYADDGADGVQGTFPLLYHAWY
jgi:hypothetical protein